MLDQAVIAAATANGRLTTQMGSHPLKYRQVVIVETANQTRIDSVRKPSRIQNGPDAVQVGKRLVAQKVHQLGGRLDHGLQRWVLAIEHPQRIGVKPAA